MCNKKEFILKFDMPGETKKQFLLLIPFLVIAFFVFLYFLNYLTKMDLPFAWKNVKVLSFLFFLVKPIAFIFMGLTIFLFSIILFTFLSFSKNNVMAVVNEKGLKLKFYNFIPWEYVERIEEYKSSYSPQAPIQLALWLKTDKQTRKNLSFSAKMGIFWSKITGYQHITFGGMDSEENLRILEFAQDCLKKLY